MSQVHTDFIKNSGILERITKSCTTIADLVQRIEYEYTLHQITEDVWKISSELNGGDGFNYDQAMDIAIAFKYAIYRAESVGDFEENLLSILNSKEF